MMKRILIAGAMAGVLATPAFAQNDSFADRVLTQENVGRALGAVAGGLVGSQIGDGRGKTIATAAGAVGGYILGGKLGRDWGGNRAATYGGSGYQGGAYRNTSRLAPLREMPQMDIIDATYEATTTSNVRGGPGTRYVVVDQLYTGEPTRVVGRVINTDWYMVADGDVIKGFVYAPLLRPVDEWSRNASRRNDGGYVTDRYVSDTYRTDRHREFAF